MLTTVVGLCLDFRVAAKMFFSALETEDAFPETPVVLRLTLAVAVACQILIGVNPWPVLDLAREALPF